MMNKTKQWMAVLCACALAGCAQDRMNSDNNGMASTGSSSSSGGSSGANWSNSSTGANNTSTGSTSGYDSANNQASTSDMTGSSNAQNTGYGIIQNIEPLQRQDISAGTVGAAAVGGTGMSSDKVYRVSLRMDDGSTQQVVVDSMPNYRKGDRVRYNNGALEGVQ